METLIQIQKVESESLGAALHLLRRFFDEEGFVAPAERMPTSLSAMVQSPDCAVFLAVHGAEALGVATVAASIGIEYGRSAELEDLYVVPQQRGAGVASALIEAAAGWCRQQGCTTMLVTVTPTGEATHKLTSYYERRGFANTGRLILERLLEP